MNIQQWLAVLLLSGLVAAPAVAFEIKPGEWEVETKMSGLPMEMEVPKIKVCITPEQAKENPANIKPPTDCKVKILKKNKGMVSYEVSCKNQVAAKGTVKKVSDNEFVTDATTTVSEGGQKQTLRTTIRQKYIGATCSKEAMQNSGRP